MNSLRSYHVPTSEPLSDDELATMFRLLGEACSIQADDSSPTGRLLYQSLLASWSAVKIMQDARKGACESANAMATRFHQHSLLELVQ